MTTFLGENPDPFRYLIDYWQERPATANQSKAHEKGDSQMEGCVTVLAVYWILRSTPLVDTHTPRKHNQSMNPHPSRYLINWGRCNLVYIHTAEHNHGMKSRSPSRISHQNWGLRIGVSNIDSENDTLSFGRYPNPFPLDIFIYWGRHILGIPTLRRWQSFFWRKSRSNFRYLVFIAVDA